MNQFDVLKSAAQTDSKGNLKSPIKGFSMNTKHLFIWNVLEAWKLQISNDVENSTEPFKEFEKLTLYVDPDEK